MRGPKEYRHWMKPIAIWVFLTPILILLFNEMLMHPELILSVVSLINLMFVISVYFWDRSSRKERRKTEIRLHWFRKHVSEKIDENVETFFNKCLEIATKVPNVKASMTVGEYSASAKSLFASYQEAKEGLFDRLADYASIVDPEFEQKVRDLSFEFQDEFTERLNREFHDVIWDSSAAWVEMIEQQRVRTLRFVYLYEVNGCQLLPDNRSQQSLATKATVEKQGYSRPA